MKQVTFDKGRWIIVENFEVKMPICELCLEEANLDYLLMRKGEIKVLCQECWDEVGNRIKQSV